MPEIKTYKDCKVTVLHQTPNPGRLVLAAVQLTQKQLDINECTKEASDFLCKFLLDADHLSVIEHAGMSFLLENVSRSLLAQLTRHRIGSFTAASQHYQDYRNYPCIISPELTEPQNMHFYDSLDTSVDAYIYAIDELNVPPEEARQLLSNAASVSIIWTVNARSLVNFFQQRLCHRNTLEMRYFARRIYAAAYKWWINLFGYVGPECFRDGQCMQGKMACQTGKFPDIQDLEDFTAQGFNP